MLLLTSSVRMSLDLLFLHIPHYKIFYGSLFPGILFTCPNHRSWFYSITSKMFFSKSPSQLPVHNLFTCWVFSVHVCPPYSQILGTKAWKKKMNTWNVYCRLFKSAGIYKQCYKHDCLLVWKNSIIFVNSSALQRDSLISVMENLQ
jgi:hypothetical protein